MSLEMIHTTYIVLLRLVLKYIIHILTLTDDTILTCHKIEFSKIEKGPRGIRGEKSSKDMASSRNHVSTLGAQASPTMGDGTRCPEGLAFPAGILYHTRCKCSMETTHNR